MIWLIAIIAALAMVVQDVLSVFVVQAEARNRAVLTGVFDTAAWLAVVTTQAISITALQGHDLREKVVVIVFISCANFAGSVLGVVWGKHFIKAAI